MRFLIFWYYSLMCFRKVSLSVSLGSISNTTYTLKQTDFEGRAFKLKYANSVALIGWLESGHVDDCWKMLAKQSEEIYIFQFKLIWTQHISENHFFFHKKKAYSNSKNVQIPTSNVDFISSMFHVKNFFSKVHKMQHIFQNIV